jgi:hypothetical protein
VCSFGGKWDISNFWSVGIFLNIMRLLVVSVDDLVLSCFLWCFQAFYGGLSRDLVRCSISVRFCISEFCLWRSFAVCTDVVVLYTVA